MKGMAMVVVLAWALMETCAGAQDSSATKPAGFPRIATIREVLKACEPPKDPSDLVAEGHFALCVGYISGLLDVFSGLSNRALWEPHNPPLHLCLPAKGVSVLTAVSALRVYAAADAKRLDEPVRASLIGVLAQVFPRTSD